MRLDIALVQKQFFESRTKAKEAIENGLVFYNFQQITKPSFEVTELEKLEVHGELIPYVSRGGLKLEKALQSFQINLKNEIVLDIGSSTGGFTDCALQHGAQKVIAVDVGQNQLSPKLRSNPAIILYEQTDFRTIELDKIDACTVAVSDVSFISLTKILPKLKQMSHLKNIICLIKPQFECGKEIAHKYHGVIKNPIVHENVLKQITTAFKEEGFFLKNLTFSPIQGGSGNIEYLAHFILQKNPFTLNLSHIVQQAFEEFKNTY